MDRRAEAQLRLGLVYLALTNRCLLLKYILLKLIWIKLRYIIFLLVIRVVPAFLTILEGQETFRSEFLWCLSIIFIPFAFIGIAYDNANCMILYMLGNLMFGILPLLNIIKYFTSHGWDYDHPYNFLLCFYAAAMLSLVIVSQKLACQIIELIWQRREILNEFVTLF